jgi:hypothetical protein
LNKVSGVDRENLNIKVQQGQGFIYQYVRDLVQLCIGEISQTLSNMGFASSFNIKLPFEQWLYERRKNGWRGMIPKSVYHKENSDSFVAILIISEYISEHSVSSEFNVPS